MKASDFDYHLPRKLIAQYPAEPRDQSRLMVLNRGDGSIEHRLFCDLVSYLRSGDLLVLNKSRVLPARLYGNKVDSGGRVEMLLLRRAGNNDWEALVRPGKRVKVGTRIEVTSAAGENGSGVVAEVTELRSGGIKLLSFSDESRLPELGIIPLPPYIHTPLAEPERYQTVYGDEAGSVAAPTAGLHFTTGLIDRLEQKGVDCLFVTLHVGLDTFRPVSDLEHHPIYREYGRLSAEAAGKLSLARAEGRRIICVGTTTVRLVEYVAQRSSKLEPFEGWVDLFILPGHRFQMVDALVTNFHLPRSTLLMLVSAFCGSELAKQAYAEAVNEDYRFYSFGDAMLIL